MEKKKIRCRLKEGDVHLLSTMGRPNLKVNMRPRLTEEEYATLLELRHAVKNATKTQVNEKKKPIEKNIDKDYEEFLELTKQKNQFEIFDIKQKYTYTGRQTVAIAQFSDQHIDEIVKSEIVLGMNEYNLDIAKSRFENHFYKLNKLINHHKEHYSIRQVVLLFQGDTIGGWIHAELQQTNGISPNEAIYIAKSLYISGIKYLHENLDVDEITIVCVCGNHGRETKKVQHANHNDTNKEYWMYREIKSICEMMGLTKVNFIIPNAEMTIISLFDKKYLVAHGHQFKYIGGIGGIFPSMLRWFSGMAKTLGVEAAFIGHWHQSIFTKRVIVNGSLKGYDAYALSKNLEYEKPSQNLTLLDSEFGLCNFQPIIL